MPFSEITNSDCSEEFSSDGCLNNYSIMLWDLSKCKLKCKHTFSKIPKLGNTCNLNFSKQKSILQGSFLITITLPCH